MFALTASIPLSPIGDSYMYNAAQVDGWESDMLCAPTPHSPTGRAAGKAVTWAPHLNVQAQIPPVKPVVVGLQPLEEGDWMLSASDSPTTPLPHMMLAHGSSVNPPSGLHSSPCAVMSGSAHHLLRMNPSSLPCSLLANNRAGASSTQPGTPLTAHTNLPADLGATLGDVIGQGTSGVVYEGEHA
jgi:hypothetical protein